MNDCCYRLTSSNVHTVKKCAASDNVSNLTRQKRRVEILCLDFPKTQSNQYIKSRKVTTFKNCEIFSNLYFSHVRNCKATLSGGNKYRDSLQASKKLMEIHFSIINTFSNFIRDFAWTPKISFQKLQWLLIKHERGGIYVFGASIVILSFISSRPLNFAEDVR